MVIKSGVSKLIRKSAAKITAVVLGCFILTSCSNEAHFTHKDDDGFSNSKDSVIESSRQSTTENTGFGVIEPTPSVSDGAAFVIGDGKADLKTAVYGRNEQYTVILFEGTFSECEVLIITAATGSLDNSSTYVQDDFGDKIEVLMCFLDPNSGELLAGSSATQGISEARITTGEDLTVSVSGKFVNETFGELSFSVCNEVTAASIDDIRGMIGDFESHATVSNSGNVSGDVGGNQPVRCFDCRGLGNCHSCGGDGTCHICVEGMTHCLSCNGSRICQKCGGKGICPYCGGDGIMYN